MFLRENRIFLYHVLGDLENVQAFKCVLECFGVNGVKGFEDRQNLVNWLYLIM